MENELTTIPFEITEISKDLDLIAKERYTAFPLSKLSSLGNAGNQILNIYKSCMKPGDEGLYMVSFPKGVEGTLSKFKNENAFLGSIKTSDSLAQARLTKESLDPEQMLIAMALMGIDQKLNVLMETQKQVLDFIYCSEESTIKADILLLNDYIAEYSSNWNNSEYIRTSLDLTLKCKMDAQKAIELYKEQATKIIESEYTIHTIEKANKEINELNRFLANAHMAYYLSSYANYFEYLLKQNFAIENHKHVESIILRNKSEYLDLYNDSKDWIEAYSKGSILYNAKSIPEKIDGFFADIVDKIPLDIPNPYRNEQKLYASAEEQIKKILPYNNAGTKEFESGLNKIYLYNTCKANMYIDDKNVYVLDNANLTQENGDE